jgi:hypothetical protein
MADRELIAAVLTAGILPTVETPQSRASGRGGALTRTEADVIQHAVDHAFGPSRTWRRSSGRERLRSLACSPDMRRAETRQLYRSRNGDAWFLSRDSEIGLTFVRHQVNALSDGQVTDLEIGAFLSGPLHPEHEALLHLMSTLILDPKGADHDEPPAANISRESSDAELTELGNMLMRGCPIEEIASVLSRDHRDVRDKVIEIGPACRELGRG